MAKLDDMAEIDAATGVVYVDELDNAIEVSWIAGVYWIAETAEVGQVAKVVVVGNVGLKLGV